MGQTTAKTVADVLNWIETTPHHFASWDDEPGFFVLKGHGGDKLRIPSELQRQTRGLTEPGGHLDARMFRANAKGRRLLREANKEPA